MKPFKVNILGVDYTVHYFKSDKKWKESDLHSYDNPEDYVGFCQGMKKNLLILDMKKRPEELAQTVRHEVTHAYQFESGIMYAMRNEDLKLESLTDWTAWQLDKIYATSKEIMDKLGRS